MVEWWSSNLGGEAWRRAPRHHATVHTPWLRGRPGTHWLLRGLVQGAARGHRNLQISSGSFKDPSVTRREGGAACDLPRRGFSLPSFRTQPMGTHHGLTAMPHQVLGGDKHLHTASASARGPVATKHFIGKRTNFGKTFRNVHSVPSMSGQIPGTVRKL